MEEKLLKLNNYFDSIIITDEKGFVKHYSNMRTDIFDLRRAEIIGKHILEIHPYLTEETSSIMKVLKNKEPIYNQIEYLTTSHGQTVTNMYSTLPIIKGNKIIGAVDFARCINENERKSILLEYNNTKAETLYRVEDIITKSDAMKDIKYMITKIADTDSSVMIYGETGTGKELIAQSIHSFGLRNNYEFISQNSSAIPSNLLESILFGTVKGSYTGSVDSKGLIEAANKGTLFLDEINSMDLNMQSKILKVIEDKQIRRIGGCNFKKVDVRIISALNENPIDCVKKGILREDLYYRLNVVPIFIPPLRERPEDIECLIQHFIDFYNSKMNKSILGLSQEVREILFKYNWPGNVREVRNIIEGAFNIVSSQYIELKDLSPYLLVQYDDQFINKQKDNEEISLYEKVEDFEKSLIIKALDSSKTISEAARSLKISKQALSYKISKYNL